MEYRIRAIVAGTDLSEHSDAPLRAAAALAEVAGAELHVVHAFDLGPLPSEPEQAAATFPERIAGAERELDRQIERAVPRTAPRPRTEVMIFTPHKAILDRAEAESADLIVVGRHRRRTIADRILGTTADQVVRGAPVPCLVVPDGVRLPVRSVLVAVDPARPTPELPDVALRFALAFGVAAEGKDAVELELLTVIAPGADRYAKTAKDALDGLAAVLTERARAEDAGVPISIEPCLIEAPTAAEGILDRADATRTDLIVIGTRSPGLVGRALVGSVASAVAREARTRVLLVPPTLWRSDENR